MTHSKKNNENKPSLFQALNSPSRIFYHDLILVQNSLVTNTYDTYAAKQFVYAHFAEKREINRHTGNKWQG